MNHAITILTIAAENAENNAPIHDAGWDMTEAALARAVAHDCRQAIAILSPPPVPAPAAGTADHRIP